MSFDLPLLCFSITLRDSVMSITDEKKICENRSYKSRIIGFPLGLSSIFESELNDVPGLILPSVKFCETKCSFVSGKKAKISPPKKR